MRHNAINLGERTLCGQYRTINSAGELTANDSDILTLHAAGESTLNGCKIGKLRSAGMVTMEKSGCDDFYNVGETVFKGECRGAKIAVCGKASAELLECELLIFRHIDRDRVHVDGESKSVTINKVIYDNQKTTADTHSISVNGSLSGYFKADVFQCEEPLCFDFDYSFGTIAADAPIFCGTELACERLIAFDAVKADSVNASSVTLLACADTEIGALTGEKIRVVRSLNMSGELGGVKCDFKRKRSVKADGALAYIGEVEGDDIYLEGAYCSRVSGINVTIGDMCVVDRVECSGELKISPKAAVGETIRS